MSAGAELEDLAGVVVLVLSLAEQVVAIQAVVEHLVGQLQTLTQVVAVVVILTVMLPV